MCVNWNCVSALSPVIATHISLTTEVRQPPPLFFLSLSLLYLPVSITFLPLINARATCGQSGCVWMCVCECVTEIIDALSCVLHISAQLSVFVCVCIQDWACFDLPCSVVFELKSRVSEAGVKAARAFG